MTTEVEGDVYRSRLAGHREREGPGKAPPLERWRERGPAHCSRQPAALGDDFAAVSPQRMTLCQGGPGGRRANTSRDSMTSELWPWSASQWRGCGASLSYLLPRGM